MHKLLRWRTLAIMALVAIALAFPYGPLFPWSPVRPGYAVAHFARAAVLYPRGTELAEDFRHVDDYLAHAQNARERLNPTYE